MTAWIKYLYAIMTKVLENFDPVVAVFSHIFKQGYFLFDFSVCWKNGKEEQNKPRREIWRDYM